MKRSFFIVDSSAQYKEFAFMQTENVSFVTANVIFKWNIDKDILPYIDVACQIFGFKNKKLIFQLGLLIIHDLHDSSKNTSNFLLTYLLQYHSSAKVRIPLVKNQYVMGKNYQTLSECIFITG